VHVLRTLDGTLRSDEPRDLEDMQECRKAINIVEIAVGQVTKYIGCSRIAQFSPVLFVLSRSSFGQVRTFCAWYPARRRHAPPAINQRCQNIKQIRIDSSTKTSRGRRERERDLDVDEYRGPSSLVG
jgi:hypothetical protein